MFVTATLSPARGGAAVKLTPYTRTLPRALPGHVRVLVGRSALRRLRRALGRRAAMRATVRIIAVGPTGLRTTVTRIYAVER